MNKKQPNKDDSRPVILLTNDDGVHAQGLETLSTALEPIAEIRIVAPDREKSGVSHAVTFHRPIRAQPVSNGTIVIDGTPTDCVLYGVLHFLDKRPDLVISGINRGPNLGDDVTYSGTVAAAMEGALLRIPSMAVSIEGGSERTFQIAAHFAKRFAEMILREGLPPRTFLNVNVPDRPLEEIGGIRICRSGVRVYQDRLEERSDPRGGKYFWLGGDEPTFVPEQNTDFDVLSNGMVAVTPLQLDWTNHVAVDHLRRWEDASLWRI